MTSIRPRSMIDERTDYMHPPCDEESVTQLSLSRGITVGFVFFYATLVLAELDGVDISSNRYIDISSSGSSLATYY